MNMRVILFWLSMLIFFSIVVYTGFSWKSVNTIGDLSYNNLIDFSIKLKIGQSTRLFQLALVSIGALWGLLIAKDGEVRLIMSNVQHGIMFVLANILILISCGSHFYYIDTVSKVYYLAGKINGKMSIMDILDSGLNNPFMSQFWSLMGGLSIVSLTFLCVHKVSENQREGE